MKKDPKLLVSHMIGSIEKIEEFVGDMDRDTFMTSSLTQDGVIRRIIIIGEAAGKLPEKFMEKWPEVPWRQMKIIRNIVVHEYFGVDLELVWNTVVDVIPELKRKLISVIK